MKLTLSTVIFTAALAGAVQAQSFADKVVQQFQDNGFTRVEVQNGPTQTKVEAIRGNQKVEVVYDRSTGGILKQETERVRAGDDTGAGVEVADRSRDFLDGERGVSSDDGKDHRGGKGEKAGDDDSRDHDSGDVGDDGEDHDVGSDDGKDHDAGDDHDAGGDDGEDHDAGDDHGGRGGDDKGDDH